MPSFQLLFVCHLCVPTQKKTLLAHYVCMVGCYSIIEFYVQVFMGKFSTYHSWEINIFPYNAFDTKNLARLIFVIVVCPLHFFLSFLHYIVFTCMSLLTCCYWDIRHINSHLGFINQAVTVEGILQSFGGKFYSFVGTQKQLDSLRYMDGILNGMDRIIVYIYINGMCDIKIIKM